MTSGFKKLVSDLQGNMEVVGNFLDNPESFYNSYSISAAERQALKSRDLKGLSSLGLAQQTAVAALSGAHSQQCDTKLF